MRDTGYTDDELRERISYLFSDAQGRNDKAEAYLKERRGGKSYGGQDDQYWTLKKEANSSISEAYDLVESGQIPWAIDNGLGNNCDMSRHITTVVARRVFDKFTDENELSDFGGRAIELKVIRTLESGGGSTAHTLTFRDPATVKTVIEQLQQELDGWDDWDGGYNEV